MPILLFSARILRQDDNLGYEIRWDDGDLRIFAGSRRDLLSRWGLLFRAQNGGIERCM